MAQVARRDYADLGAGHFDRLNVTRLTRYHTRRLSELGYAVTLTPTEKAA
jgi:hypothetical protein